VKKGIVLVIAALALLTGCGPQGDKTAGIPVGPKWKGAPYRLAFDKQTAKPNPAVVTIPGIKFTANPDALERRVVLVVRFDSFGDTKHVPTINKMIMSPVDISGAEGTLPKDYVAAANKDLTGFFTGYCVKGKIAVSVALARSSLTSQAGDTEMNDKRMSDWLPLDFVFKNRRPGC